MLTYYTAIEPNTKFKGEQWGRGTPGTLQAMTLENNDTWKVLKIKEKWSCQQNILHLKKYIPLKGVK